MARSHEVLVVGAGIVGAACALALRDAGMDVGLLDAATPGAGVTAAGMGHLVALDEDDWRCPWPAEADADEIDEQSAIVRVEVGADGKVEAVSIVRDPGHGFGQAAARCAEKARFRAALDRGGKAVRAQSPPIRVRFVR